MSQLSFRSFLKEVRFAYIVGTSVLIFLLIVGLFEIISVTFLEQGDPELIRYLHLTRGAVTVTVLLGWIAWTLYEFRDRFLTVLRKSTGEVESYLIVIRDLTERAMRQAQMERSERLASLGHMAAGVVHEIGNPLTAISSMVQLIQRKVTDTAQKEQLAQIRTNIGRIAQIVRDLVDFSRPKPVEVAPVYAHMLVNEVIGLLKHDARCRNILFDTSGVRPVPVVNAVPDKLFQVLVNLILNAVDATLGNPAPEVRIHVQTASSGIEILVFDNGKGIPHEFQTRIFEPFFTTKDVGKGTGLGLSVSHHIIEQFGGSLSVTSVPGNTEFRISLPLAQ